jgi:excinuclease ABC subunit A
MGPGSGINGGKIVAVGTPEEIANDKHSLTAPYLREHLQFLKE